MFSVRQTDVIIYGDDLLDYVQHEFGSQNAARDGRTLGAHLARLAEEDDRAHRLSDLKTAIAHTSGTSAAIDPSW